MAGILSTILSKFLMSEGKAGLVECFGGENFVGDDLLVGLGGCEEGCDGGLEPVSAENISFL
jgi:hypothetical protein